MVTKLLLCSTFSAVYLLSGAESKVKCLTELAGPRGTNSATVAEILDAPLVLDPDSLKKGSLTVLSFDLTIRGKKDVELRQVNSNRLSNAQFNAIGYANVGDKIYIENIAVIAPDASALKLAPISFTIISPCERTKRRMPTCGTGILENGR